jgi:hypothetical protein
VDFIHHVSGWCTFCLKTNHALQHFIYIYKQRICERWIIRYIQIWNCGGKLRTPGCIVNLIYSFELNIIYTITLLHWISSLKPEDQHISSESVFPYRIQWRGLTIICTSLVDIDVRLDVILLWMRIEWSWKISRCMDTSQEELQSKKLYSQQLKH